MKAPSYPLEAARSLRKNDVEAAQDAFARTLNAIAAAEEELARKERSLTSHVDATKEMIARELALDSAGRTIDEMMRARAHETRRREEEAVLRSERADASHALERMRRVSEDAREALAQARAAHEAIERNHEAWVKEQRRQMDARAEAEVDDVVAARRATRKSE